MLEVTDEVMVRLEDGEACSHKGCELHCSHPCEVCGRTGARGVVSIPQSKYLRERNKKMITDENVEVLDSLWYPLDTVKGCLNFGMIKTRDKITGEIVYYMGASPLSDMVMDTKYIIRTGQKFDKKFIIDWFNK
jgi:hypothetical protein